MKILKSSNGLNAESIFRMTQDPKVDQVKNHGGEVLTLNEWVYYTDTNSNGKEIELLALSCEECTVATNSPTFIGQFLKMIEFFSENDMVVHRIEVIEDLNLKTNRTFYNVSYID